MTTDKPHVTCCHDHRAKIWISHTSQGNVFGTADQNDRWMVASGVHSVFYENRWPDLPGWFPTSSGDLQAPINNPCQPGEFKDPNGVCVSGVTLKYYDNYMNSTPPRVYNPASNSMQITLAGVSQNGTGYRNGTCASLNGTCIITDLADIALRTPNQGSDQGYYNTGDLCFLGSMPLNNTQDGIDNMAMGGYTAVSFYLFLSGDDPYNSAAGVTPSGAYWRGNYSKTDEKIVYRTDEVLVKPQLWLAVEFKNQMVPVPAISGAIYGYFGGELNVTGWGGDIPNQFPTYLGGGWSSNTSHYLHENNRKTSKSQFFSGSLLNGLGNAPGTDCSLVFAKPIGTYNGDYIVSIPSGLYWYADRENLLYSSLIPYHPRCDSELYTEGNFDGLNLDLDVSFSWNDLYAPTNGQFWNWYSYLESNGHVPYSLRGDLEPPCNFNFNVSITTIDASPYSTLADPSTKQAFPSMHLKGAPYQYCSTGSNWNRGIIGYGGMYNYYGISWTVSDNKQFIYIPYNPDGSADPFNPLTGIHQIYYDDPNLPFGSFPTSATVTFNGVSSIELGHDPTCKDCQDCEDLNGTHRLVYEMQYSESYVTEPSYARHKWHMYFDHEVVNRSPYDDYRRGLICCPCGSGLCLHHMELSIFPHLDTGYDSNIFLSVYQTGVEVNLYNLDGNNVAKYRKYLQNTYFVDSSIWFGNKQVGLIEPLTINAFDGLELNLVSYDPGYVRNTLTDDGYATGCNLPDTVTIGMSEVTQYNKTLAITDGGLYNNDVWWDELPQVIAVQIPNGWRTTFTKENVNLTHASNINTTCDIQLTLLGANFPIHNDDGFRWPYTWYLYDCGGLKSKFLTEKNKVKCPKDVQRCTKRENPWAVSILRDGINYIYKGELINCADSSKNGLTDYIKDSPCSALLFSATFSGGTWIWIPNDLKLSCPTTMDMVCPISDFPTGTFGLTLQAPRPGVGDLSNSNAYIKPLREPTQCDRNDWGLTWAYFDDPCSMFTLKSDAEIPFFDEDCTYNSPVANDDDWYGNGVDCGCHSSNMFLNYEITWFDEDGKVLTIPNVIFTLTIRFNCQIGASLGVYPNSYYGAQFTSGRIPLDEIGGCNAEGQWKIIKDRITSVDLFPGTECYENYFAPYFWNTAPIRMTIA